MRINRYVSLAFFATMCESIENSAFADSIDVFPLKVGIQSTYLYKNQFTGWGMFRSSNDSGSVQLTLIDSSMSNDTTVVWSFRERREFVHWQRQFNGTDTTYRIVDSTMRELYESTIGLHELNSSSLFWNFPASIPNGPSLPIFRYADSTFTLESIRTTNCPTFAIPSRYDSMWFSLDSGVVDRRWARCEDGDWYGWASWSALRLLSRIVVSVEQPPSIPLTVKLSQNYPNPFNPKTVITFRIPSRGFVELKVFDVLGREVATLVNETKELGEHSTVFDPLQSASGVYMYRLRTDGSVLVRKMLLLK